MNRASAEIPETWVQATIGDVCTQPQYGYTTKASGGGDLLLLRTSDITSDSIAWETVPYCSINPVDIEPYLLEDGDILVSRAGSVGVSRLITNPKKAVFASYLIRFRPLIDGRYLSYFLESPGYWAAINSEKLGIAVPNVNATKLKSVQVPIPPIQEQHRIVAKIEELFSELDKGIESLKTALRQLEVYRQSVLKHAFEGKLTARWREENKDKLETPKELLARVKKVRAARYEQELQEWERAVKTWEAEGKHGKRPSKPGGVKPQTETPPEEMERLPSIPRGWSFVRLCQVAEVGSGMSVSATRKLEDSLKVPYLRVANVQRGFLDLTEVKHMTIERSQLESLQLKQWDVLFNEGGDRDKLGRGWIWQSEITPCITQNHVFRASPYLASEFNSKLLSFGPIRLENGILTRQANRRRILRRLTRRSSVSSRYH